MPYQQVGHVHLCISVYSFSEGTQKSVSYTIVCVPFLRGQWTPGHWHHYYAQLASAAPECCLLLCMLTRPALAVRLFLKVRPSLRLQW